MSLQKIINSDKKLVFIVFLVSVSLSLVQVFFSNKPEEQNQNGIATHIPRGYLLLPIELENYQMLDQILGQSGVVKLFQNLNGKKQLIAKGVRLIRSPHNPQQVALLVPDKQAEWLLNRTGPYWAAIQNPNEYGTEIVRKHSRPQRLQME